jgi:NAD(P)-dependent dehydrogenase (short-subunit alcohol dehydrogenase family)
MRTIRYANSDSKKAAHSDCLRSRGLGLGFRDIAADDTDMVRAVPADVLEKIIARIPVGRLGRAEDIARTVLFLVADDADFITGSTLSVNGGQHMY